MFYLLIAVLVQIAESCPRLCTCPDELSVDCQNVGLDAIPLDIPSDTRVLYLSKNRLSEISDSSFSQFEDLTDLYLDNNRIHTVHANAFLLNRHLRLLNLSSNVLSKLPLNLFTSNDGLSQLDLRYNPGLQDLPYSVVGYHHSLQSLHMNNIDCTRCAMVDWYYNFQYFAQTDVNVDIVCYYPSEYRGQSLQTLPAAPLFHRCGEPDIAPTCPELSCGNGDCYDAEYHCDGNYDCMDKSDETDCDATPSTHIDCTMPSSWNCSNGINCVAVEWRCDGVLDCEDGSDEEHCDTTGECEAHSCANGRCIEQTAVCDGVNDCGDWSDETKLMCGERQESGNVCGRGYLPCRGAGNCVEHWKMCNGVADCSDGTDEENCFGNCSSGMTECRGDGRCIREQWLCDGIPDCVDKSDEENCRYTCEEEQFRCGSGCLSCSFVCDGIVDCPGQVDERNCSLCNASMCLESPVEGTSGNLTTVIIIATSISGSVSLISIIIFIIVYRGRRSKNSSPPRLPAYSEIAMYTSSSPPPRYKSEPDIPERLVNIHTDTQTENLTSL